MTSRERKGPKAWQGTIHEFLGEVGWASAWAPGPGGAEALRTRLGLLGDPELHGSVIGEWISSGDVPSETRGVVRAGLVLRLLGTPAEAWGDLRRALGAAAGTVALGWGGRGVLLGEEDPDLEAFRRVDAVLGGFEDAAREAEAVLEAGGYELRDGAIVTPTGGNPRALLRDLVEVLLADAHQNREEGSRNTRDLREWIASELAALPFPASLLDVSSGAVLDTAIGNIQRQRKGSRKPSP